MRSWLRHSLVRYLLSFTLIITFGVLLFAPVAAQDATPTVPPATLPDADAIVVIEGPVVAININIITIYNFDIQVAADNPILTVIKVGDFVHVEGERDARGILVATVVTTTMTTVTLNGQVTAINANTVVINNVDVQFEPDDPTLTLIKVGDILNVDGNFRGSGSTLVLIVVNVVFVNEITIVNLPANCKVSKNGHIKCSKKHH